MRLNRTIVAGIAVVFATALPAVAAEPAAPEATGPSPEASAPAQPAEFPWLTPEPTPTAGQKPGPCTVSVPCRFGPAVSCSGQVVCEWQYDSKWIRGYVHCDPHTPNESWIYCPLGGT